MLPSDAACTANRCSREAWRVSSRSPAAVHDDADAVNAAVRADSPGALFVSPAHENRRNQTAGRTASAQRLLQRPARRGDADPASSMPMTLERRRSRTLHDRFQPRGRIMPRSPTCPAPCLNPLPMLTTLPSRTTIPACARISDRVESADLPAPIPIGTA